MLEYAIKMIKSYIWEVCNESDHRKYADKISRRVVAALIRHDGILKRNINGIHLLYEPIRSHGVDLYGVDKFHLVQE